MNLFENIMWQKEKILILSKFSFCHTLFKCSQSKDVQNVSASGTWLYIIIYSMTNSLFTRYDILETSSFEKI